VKEACPAFGSGVRHKVPTNGIELTGGDEIRAATGLRKSGNVAFCNRIASIAGLWP